MVDKLPEDGEERRVDKEESLMNSIKEIILLDDAMETKKWQRDILLDKWDPEYDDYFNPQEKN